MIAYFLLHVLPYKYQISTICMMHHSEEEAQQEEVEHHHYFGNVVGPNPSPSDVKEETKQQHPSRSSDETEQNQESDSIFEILSDWERGERATREERRKKENKKKQDERKHQEGVFTTPSSLLSPHSRLRPRLPASAPALWRYRASPCGLLLCCHVCLYTGHAYAMFAI